MPNNKKTAKRGFSYALHLLTRRPYSIKKLTRKLLQKDYSVEVVEEIVEKLRNYNYLNDDVYCEQLASYYHRFKNYSLNQIKQKCFQKGIETSTWQSFIEQNRADETEQARNVLTKYQRKWQHLNAHEMKQKAAQKLFQRGFSGSTIAKILRNLQFDGIVSDEGSGT